MAGPRAASHMIPPPGLQVGSARFDNSPALDAAAFANPLFGYVPRHSRYASVSTREQPDHDANAPADNLIAVRWGMRF